MLRLVHRGIGASGSVAFCTTVGVIERSGRLRSNTIINNIHAPRAVALRYNICLLTETQCTEITACALKDLKVLKVLNVLNDFKALNSTKTPKKEGKTAGKC